MRAAGCALLKNCELMLCARRAACVTARRLLVQRQRVAPPGGVLPAAEVGEQLRRACRAHQRKILDAQLLEAPAKTSVLLNLARDQEAVGGNRGGSWRTKAVRWRARCTPIGRRGPGGRG